MVDQKVTAYIGIGSNLGAKVKNCLDAISAISSLTICHLLRSSSLYLTEPIDMDGAPWFINGVVEIESLLKPHDLLKVLKGVEREMGRRGDNNAGSRVIDLDLLFYGRETVLTPDLTIPHPRLHQRRFVLAPLAEIAPHFVHPILYLSVSELIKTLKDGNPVVRRLDSLDSETL